LTSQAVRENNPGVVAGCFGGWRRCDGEWAVSVEVRLAGGKSSECSSRREAGRRGGRVSGWLRGRVRAEAEGISLVNLSYLELTRVNFS
jgi:hypothetical protein